MKKVIIFFAIVLTLVIAGYLSYTRILTEQVFFFVSNDSDEDMPPVQLEVLVDDNILIKDTFAYSKVVPHYTSYEKRLTKGKHLIKVKSNGKIEIEEKKAIELEKPLYIFVSFHYDTLFGKELQAKKEIFYMTHDSTTAFEPRTLVNRKDIVIHVMDEKPIHQ